MKQQSDLVRDMTDPGWREREAEAARKFSEVMAPRRPGPIGAPYRPGPTGAPYRPIPGVAS